MTIKIFTKTKKRYKIDNQEEVKMKKEEKLLKEEFKNTEIGKNMYKKYKKNVIILIIIFVLYVILLIGSLEAYGGVFSGIIPYMSVFELLLFFVFLYVADAFGEFNGAFKYFKWEKENKKIKD